MYRLCGEEFIRVVNLVLRILVVLNFGNTEQLLGSFELVLYIQNEFDWTTNYST
jgi:hypothetical protein